MTSACMRPREGGGLRQACLAIHLNVEKSTRTHDDIRTYVWMVFAKRTRGTATGGMGMGRSREACGDGQADRSDTCDMDASWKRAEGVGRVEAASSSSLCNPSHASHHHRSSSVHTYSSTLLHSRPFLLCAGAGAERSCARSGTAVLSFVSVHLHRLGSKQRSPCGLMSAGPDAVFRPMRIFPPQTPFRPLCP